MADKPQSLNFWSFKSVRLFLALTFCLAVLANALIQNTLSMAMVCMVNSSYVQQPNKSTHMDDKSDCPAINSEKEEYDGTFNWKSFEQGFMFSAFFIGGLITTLPAGWLADRYDPKTLVTVSITLSTLGCFLSPITAQTGGYIGLVVLRFIMGLFGQALIFTGVSSISARWIPPMERSTVVALYTVGNQMANAIGMPLNAYLCSTKFLGGWPAIFYVTGVIAAVSGVLWVLLASNRPESNRFISEEEKNYIIKSLATQNLGTRKSATRHVPWISMMLSPALLTCLFSMFSGGLMAAALSNYIPTYLKEALHIDLVNNGLLSALPYILQSIGKIFFAIVADLIKKKTNIPHIYICKFFNTLSCLGVAAFLLACSFMTCSTSGWAVAFLSLANLFLSGLTPGFLTSIVCIAPAFTGIVMAVTRFAGQLAAVIAPLMVAALTRGGGTVNEWRHVFFVIAGIMLLSGLLFLICGSISIQEWAKMPNVNIKIAAINNGDVLQMSHFPDDAKVDIESVENGDN